MYINELLFISSLNHVLLYQSNDGSDMIGSILGILVTVAIVGIGSYIFNALKGKKDEVGEDTNKSQENEIIETNKNQQGLIEPSSTYFAPEIKIQNRTKTSNKEIISLEFADGVKGRIFYKISKNEYFFKENSVWGVSNYYDSFTNCINAFHYFKTSGKVLKVGLTCIKL